MQLHSDAPEKNELQLEGLLQLSNEFVRGFMTLTRQGYPLPSSICLLGAERRPIEILAAEMRAGFAAQFLQDITIQLPIEKWANEMSTYRIDVDYFCTAGRKAWPHI